MRLSFCSSGFETKPLTREESGIGGAVILIAAPGRRLGQPGAVEAALGGQRQKLIEGVVAEDLKDALGGLAHRGRDQQRVRGRVQLEMLVRMGERVMRNQRCYM